MDPSSCAIIILSNTDKNRCKGDLRRFLYAGKERDRVGRPRKFKTPDELHSAWETYKAYCDSKPVLTHAFNSKTGEFVSAELKHSVTYTIEGFCVYVGISRQAFHEYYAESKRFVDIVTRMREECETDAREKFEVGAIPTQLAGLWMSKYGYTTKQEADVEVKPSEKLSDILSQLGGDDLDST